jgi:asparagine synthase (glutamine-hydrolysing)
VELVSDFRGWKYRNGRSKVLLKSAAEKVLPPGIIHRPKHGFMPPVREWLRGGLKSYMQEHLLDSEAISAQWIEPAATRAMVRRYLAGEQHLYLAIWELLCLEVWLRGMKSADATRARSR